MQTITSVKNPLIKSLKALSRRQERENAGRILVEGEVMIREALKCGLMLKDVLCVERKADFAAGLSGEAILVPEEVMQAVCDTRTPQGVCASFQAPAPRKAEELPNPVVALDGVQDPGNAGTIWRTADAAGFGACCWERAARIPCLPRYCARPWARPSGYPLPGRNPCRRPWGNCGWRGIPFYAPICTGRIFTAEVR